MRPEQSVKARRAERGRRLWTTYRITEEMWDKQYAHQGGLCGLCLRPGEDLDGQHPMVPDECKKTGRFRGLLHHNCNRHLTEQAEDYLENPPAYGVVDHVIPETQRAAMTRKRELDRARRRKKRREQKEAAEAERTTYRYGTGASRTLADRLAKASKAAS